MQKIVLTALAVLMLWGAPKTQANDVTLYTEDFPPYNHLSASGQVVGRSTERVIALMNAAGLSYQIKLMPWARTYRAALNDPSGLVYSIIRTENREAELDWLSSVGKPAFYMFARADDNREYTYKSVLAGLYTAACAATDASCSMLRRMGFPETSLYVSDGLGLSETIMINYYRVDLYLGDLNHHPYRMKELALPPNATKPVLPVDSDMAFYLAASYKVSKELRDRVRQAALALNIGDEALGQADHSSQN